MVIVLVKPSEKAPIVAFGPHVGNPGYPKPARVECRLEVQRSSERVQQSSVGAWAANRKLERGEAGRDLGEALLFFMVVIVVLCLLLFRMVVNFCF